MLNLLSVTKKINSLIMTLVVLFSLPESKSEANTEVTPSKAIIIDGYWFFQREITAKKSIRRNLIYGEVKSLGAEEKRDFLNIDFHVAGDPVEHRIFASKRNVSVVDAIDDQGRNLLDIEKMRQSKSASNLRPDYIPKAVREGLLNPFEQEQYDRLCPAKEPSVTSRKNRLCDLSFWGQNLRLVLSNPRDINFDTGISMEIFADSKMIKKLKGFQEVAVRGREIFRKKFTSDLSEQRIKDGDFDINLQTVSLLKTSPTFTEIKIKVTGNKAWWRVGQSFAAMFTITGSEKEENVTVASFCQSSPEGADCSMRFSTKSKPPYILTVWMPEIKKIPIELRDVVIPR
jgi:hypothetical protein